MMEISWIKLSVGLFQNRKIKRILTMPRGNEILLFWIRLLCLGGTSNYDGKLMFTEEEPFDAEGLAVECDLPTPLVREWLSLFISFHMMSSENGIYRITGWEKYQSAEELARIRAQNRLRKQRERAAQKQADERMSRDICVTERDSHATEEEKEREKEKNMLASELACDPEQRRWLAREALGGKLGRGKVLLSEAQMADLLERLSLEEFDHYVSVVADIEENGRGIRSKTHYEAILEMAAKDRRTLSAMPKARGKGT